MTGPRCPGVLLTRKGHPPCRFRPQLFGWCRYHDPYRRAVRANLRAARKALKLAQHLIEQVHAGRLVSPARLPGDACGG